MKKTELLWTARIQAAHKNFKLWAVRGLNFLARVNQQLPMHQFADLSFGWAVFFHLTSNGVHHNSFLFAADHCTFFWGFVFCCFFPEPDLTHSYPTILTTYLTNQGTMLLTYLTNLTSLLY